jgi:hypothetical protein
VVRRGFLRCCRDARAAEPGRGDFNAELAEDAENRADSGALRGCGRGWVKFAGGVNIPGVSYV